jgi:hypothetical protein
MRGSTFIIAVLLLSLFVACTPPELVDIPTSPRPVITDPGTVRPDIPRTPPTDTPIPEYQNPGEQPSNNIPWPITNVSAGAKLDVPLGETIGKHHPIITRSELPLLRHDPIRVHDNLLIGYEERIMFDHKANTTGKVVYRQDDDERIGSFLLFEEDKPILTYELTLDSSAFPRISGREIEVLGNRYLIAEATNTSVALFGIDIASNLFFEDGEPLDVNSTTQRRTVARVRPNMIGFQLYADGPKGDILLAPGDSLAKIIGRKSFGTDQFDITYIGAPTQERTAITIDQNKHGYVLRMRTKEGDITFPLVEEDAGRLVFGRLDEPLRITPCPASRYCVAPDTLLPFTTSDGRTYLRTYDDATDSTVIFSDKKGNTYTYHYTGTPGKDANVNVVVGEQTFRCKVGPRDNRTGDYNITVEQGYKNGRVEIVAEDGSVVRVGDMNATGLLVTLTIPAARTPSKKDEATRFLITYPWRVSVSNATATLPFYQEEDEDDALAMTPYGVGIVLSDFSRPASGDDATITIPKTRAYGIVSIG